MSGGKAMRCFSRHIAKCGTSFLHLVACSVGDGGPWLREWLDRWVLNGCSGSKSMIELMHILDTYITCAHTHIIYIYIYAKVDLRGGYHTHTRTHTHIYIHTLYIYIRIYSTYLIHDYWAYWTYKKLYVLEAYSQGVLYHWVPGSVETCQLPGLLEGVCSPWLTKLV